MKASVIIVFKLLPLLFILLLLGSLTSRLGDPLFLWWGRRSNIEAVFRVGGGSSWL